MLQGLPLEMHHDQTVNKRFFCLSTKTFKLLQTAANKFSEDQNCKLVDMILPRYTCILCYFRGYLYWTEWGSQPRISRISMDGKSETRSVLIDKNIEWPNALAIDYRKGTLWWADAKLGKIERCNLYGTNRRIVTEQNVGSPFSIAVSPQYVYWTNWDNGRIERIEKESWNKNQIQSGSYSSYPLGIALIDGGKHEAGMLKFQQWFISQSKISPLPHQKYLKQMHSMSCC